MHFETVNYTGNLIFFFCFAEQWLVIGNNKKKLKIISAVCGDFFIFCKFIGQKFFIWTTVFFNLEHNYTFKLSVFLVFLWNFEDEVDAGLAYFRKMFIFSIII